MGRNEPQGRSVLVRRLRNAFSRSPNARGLVSLVDTLHTDSGDVRVVVIESASPDCFSAHVDLTAVPQYTAKAGGPGDASLGMFLYELARVPAITIAKVRGRARGGGDELAWRTT